MTAIEVTRDDDESQSAADLLAAAADEEHDLSAAIEPGEQLSMLEQSGEPVKRKRGRPRGSRGRKKRRSDKGIHRGPRHDGPAADAQDAASQAVRAARHAARDATPEADGRDDTIAELKQQLEVEQIKAAARTDEDLVVACGELIGFMFDGVASVRGEFWALTAGGRARLGTAAAKVLAKYVPSMVQYSPELELVTMLAGEARPRIMFDMKKMSAEDFAAAMKHRDGIESSVFSRVADAAATPPSTGTVE